MKPKVSVIMPARNEEQYIERAINSVLQQTYSNFEFLILNDKSTDRTGEIIKSYASKDKRIKYLEGKAIGVAAARNTLFSEASGDFIVNADADDFCKPQRIEKLVSHALKIGEPCIVGSNYDLYKDGELLRIDTFPVEHCEIKKRIKQFFNRYAISPGLAIGSAHLYKTTPVQNKFKILSDWDQLLRIQENPDVKLGNVNESLYIYYLNHGSMTRKAFKRTLFSAFLRDCEVRRLKRRPEFETLEIYLKNFWKEPYSFVTNSFMISTKYIQQKLEF